MIIGNDSRKMDAASLAVPLVNDGLSAKTGGGCFHVAAVVKSFSTTRETSGETATAPTQGPSPAPPSLALHGHVGNSWPTSPSHMAASWNEASAAARVRAERVGFGGNQGGIQTLASG